MTRMVGRRKEKAMTIFRLHAAIGVALITMCSRAVSAADTTQSASTDLNQDLKSYQPVNGVTGSLSSVGSDTLNEVMKL